MEREIPILELARAGPLVVRTPPFPDLRRFFFDHFGWRMNLGADPDSLDGLSGLTIARTHLDATVKLLLTRWDAIELLRQYSPELRCTHRCLRATKLLCACPCSGEHHGSQADELPALGPEGNFELIGTGMDDWSLSVITHQRS